MSRLKINACKICDLTGTGSDENQCSSIFCLIKYVYDRQKSMQNKDSP